MPSLMLIIVGLAVLLGVACYLGYRYLVREQGKLGERKTALLRAFLIVAGASGLVFIVSAILHNLISAFAHTEEAVFFILAVVVAPLGLIVGLVGSLVVILGGLGSPQALRRKRAGPGEVFA